MTSSSGREQSLRCTCRSTCQPRPLCFICPVPPVKRIRINQGVRMGSHLSTLLLLNIRPKPYLRLSRKRLRLEFTHHTKHAASGAANATPTLHGLSCRLALEGTRIQGCPLPSPRRCHRCLISVTFCPSLIGKKASLHSLRARGNPLRSKCRDDTFLKMPHAIPGGWSHVSPCSGYSCDGWPWL